MVIKNARVYVGHSFLDCDIEFEREIVALGKTDKPADIDARGAYIIPGLVDIHTHGGAGYDFSDGDETALPKLSKYYAEHGVTSFLATTMTLDEGSLIKAVSAIANGKTSGAKCAGIHLEGPFISPDKCGAQNKNYVLSPDIALFDRLLEASGGKIKTVTLAPELEGADELIRHSAEKCAVSLGHTCADYDTAMRAFSLGASRLTHMFNAMPEMCHRRPGVIGAALDTGAYAELICDGIHVHPSAVRAAFKMFGERICLVSDSLRCAYMPDGEYDLAGLKVTLKNKKATLSGSETIAGSAISLLDGIKNAVRFGIPLEDAVYSATTAPAKAVGLDAGEICIGKSADLVMLDENLELMDVYIDGRRVVTK